MRCGFFILIVFFLVIGCSQKKSAKMKPLDPANMDLTVSPTEDFYHFANGNWLKNNPIPPEYSRWGSFEYLAEKNLKDLRTILEEAATDTTKPKGSNLRKIGDFYASGMDSAKIEAEGIQPIREELDRIEAVKSKKELQEAMAHLQSLGTNAGFYFFSAQDKKNSGMMIGWLYQGGLGLPDRDYYLNKDERSKHLREKYVAHVTNMFKLLGQSPEQAAQSAQTVMKVETRLAKASMTRLEQRNPVATYHKMPVKKLQKLAPDFDWTTYFQNVGVAHPGEINVAQPEFFKAIGKMMRQVRLKAWKTYLCWQFIHSAADYLNTAFINENFDFYGKTLQGKEELPPRWKRVLRETSRDLGEAVGQIYVERFFPPEAKQRALEMVMNLKAAFRERIKKVDWMSEKTRQKALHKLDAFNVKIGYPDKWKDYSGLEITRDSYVMNTLRAANFEFKRELAKIGKPVDRSEWGLTPQTVNAYYQPFMNEIVFPAAILQPPFFNAEADDAVNYGAMGVVIGHEMTHGFDDQGRQFDEKGNLNDWWTKEDAEKFKARAALLADEFDHFTPIDTFHINGKLTLGENIADLGGLNIAYDALQKALKEHPQPKKIDGFTPEQRFFLSYAQVWRNNIRKENLILRLKTDVHSPGEFRTNGELMNLPAFYAAFGVKEGDKMYLPPEKRVKIW